MLLLLLMVVLEVNWGQGVLYLLGWSLPQFVLHVSSILALFLAVISGYLLCREHVCLAFLSGLWSTVLVVLTVALCYEMNHIFIAHWGVLWVQLGYCMVVAAVSFRYSVMLYQRHQEVAAEREECYFEPSTPYSN